MKGRTYGSYLFFTFAPYIFMAVTEGKTYTQLQMTYAIPCGKDMFYDRYRKFYWLLSKER